MELTMSQHERDRLKVLEQVVQGQMGTAQASGLLRLTQRQTQRLVAGYREQGDRVVIHKLRGRRPANALSAQRCERIVALLRAHYTDFGPTLAAEHLGLDHGIEVSRETVRRLMRQARLDAGCRRPRPHRRRRARRECFGELVQMDTSEHDWLEGRGPKMALITMIDDATSWKLSRFAPADTGQANMDLIGAWIQRFGRPCALYTDRAGHFRQPQARGKRAGLTQIERALAQLEIELIVAHSPQAKGRVERSHATDQDRLIKKMRLAGVRTLEQANAFLDEYLQQANERFTVPPHSPLDAHRAVGSLDLEAILCAHEPRTVMHDWTVRVDNQFLQIEADSPRRPAPGSKVTLQRRRDGTLWLWHRDRYLNFTLAPPQGRAVEMTACGQPAGTSPATCPQALNNAARCSQFHSHDDDEKWIDSIQSDIETLKKPVQVHNRTRKPKHRPAWT
jgi:hypothetical protein